MEVYILECILEDGNYERNGVFLKLEDAEKFKVELDNLKINIKYGIKQTISTENVI